MQKLRGRILRRFGSRSAVKNSETISDESCYLYIPLPSIGHSQRVALHLAQSRNVERLVGEAQQPSPRQPREPLNRKARELQGSK